MPKNHAEVYAEFGYNDAKQNLRDLMLDMSHSAAWVVGFKKLHPLNARTFISLQAEATKMSETPSYLMRGAGNWYEHGQVYEGFTNNNQIIANGVGHGNDAQSFAVSWNQGLLKRDAWGIPKGAKNKVNAMKFVAFSTMAIPQARVALAIPYGSVNSKSDEYIPAARQEVLPSAPAIKKQLVSYNYDWWIANREAVIPKFNKWLLS